MTEIKSIIKKTPLVGSLARRLKLKFARAIAKQDLSFSRMNTDNCVNNDDRVFQEQKIDYLRSRYHSIQLLAETSNDDSGQKQRQLFYLSAAS